MNQALPEGWESDYDGRRWYYRYKPSGIIQYHFPRPGDEYPDYIGSDAPVSLAPEELLESQKQVQRTNTGGARPGARKRTVSHLTSAAGPVPTSLDEDVDLGEGQFRYEDFMYFGPVSPIEEDKDDTPPGGGNDTNISGNVSVEPSPGPTPLRQAAAPIMNEEAVVSGPSVSTISAPPMDSGYEFPQTQTTFVMGDSGAIVMPQPLQPTQIQTQFVMNDTGFIMGDPGAPVPSQPPVSSLTQETRAELAHTDPIGFVAELAGTVALADIEVNPPPVELPDSSLLVEPEANLPAELPDMSIALTQEDHREKVRQAQEHRQVDAGKQRQRLGLDNGLVELGSSVFSTAPEAANIMAGEDLREAQRQRQINAEVERRKLGLDSAVAFSTYEVDYDGNSRGEGIQLVADQTPEALQTYTPMPPLGSGQLVSNPIQTASHPEKFQIKRKPTNAKYAPFSLTGPAAGEDSRRSSLALVNNSTAAIQEQELNRVLGGSGTPPSSSFTVGLSNSTPPPSKTSSTTVISHGVPAVLAPPIPKKEPVAADLTPTDLHQIPIPTALTPGHQKESLLGRPSAAPSSIPSHLRGPSGKFSAPNTSTAIRSAQNTQSPVAADPRFQLFRIDSSSSPSTIPKKSSPLAGSEDERKTCEQKNLDQYPFPTMNTPVETEPTTSLDIKPAILPYPITPKMGSTAPAPKLVSAQVPPPPPKQKRQSIIPYPEDISPKPGSSLQSSGNSTSYPEGCELFPAPLTVRNSRASVSPLPLCQAENPQVPATDFSFQSDVSSSITMRNELYHNPSPPSASPYPTQGRPIIVQQDSNVSAVSSTSDLKNEDFRRLSGPISPNSCPSEGIPTPATGAMSSGGTAIYPEFSYLRYASKPQHTFVQDAHKQPSLARSVSIVSSIGSPDLNQNFRPVSTLSDIESSASSDQRQHYYMTRHDSYGICVDHASSLEQEMKMTGLSQRTSQYQNQPHVPQSQVRQQDFAVLTHNNELTRANMLPNNQPSFDLKDSSDIQHCKPLTGGGQSSSQSAGLNQPAKNSHTPNSNTKEPDYWLRETNLNSFGSQISAKDSSTGSPFHGSYSHPIVSHELEFSTRATKQPLVSPDSQLKQDSTSLTQEQPQAIAKPPSTPSVNKPLPAPNISPLSATNDCYHQTSTAQTPITLPTTQALSNGSPLHPPVLAQVQTQQQRHAPSKQQRPQVPDLTPTSGVRVETDLSSGPINMNKPGEFQLPSSPLTQSILMKMQQSQYGPMGPPGINTQTIQGTAPGISSPAQGQTLAQSMVQTPVSGRPSSMIEPIPPTRPSNQQPPQPGKLQKQSTAKKLLSKLGRKSKDIKYSMNDKESSRRKPSSSTSAPPPLSSGHSSHSSVFQQQLPTASAISMQLPTNEWQMGPSQDTAFLQNLQEQPISSAGNSSQGKPPISKAKPNLPATEINGSRPNILEEPEPALALPTVAGKPPPERMGSEISQPQQEPHRPDLQSVFSNIPQSMLMEQPPSEQPGVSPSLGLGPPPLCQHKQPPQPAAITDTSLRVASATSLSRSSTPSRISHPDSVAPNDSPSSTSMHNSIDSTPVLAQAQTHQIVKPHEIEILSISQQQISFQEHSSQKSQAYKNKKPSQQESQQEQQPILTNSQPVATYPGQHESMQQPRQYPLSQRQIVSSISPEPEHRVSKAAQQAHLESFSNIKFGKPDPAMASQQALSCSSSSSPHEPNIANGSTPSPNTPAQLPVQAQNTGDFRPWLPQSSSQPNSRQPLPSQGVCSKPPQNSLPDLQMAPPMSSELSTFSSSIPDDQGSRKTNKPSLSSSEKMPYLSAQKSLQSQEKSPPASNLYSGDGWGDEDDPWE